MTARLMMSARKRPTSQLTTLKIGKCGSPPPEPYVAKASRGEPKEESTVARLVREARSAQHAFGHRYHNPFCKHCVRANAQRKRIKKGTLARGPKPEKFGMQSRATTLSVLNGRTRRKKPSTWSLVRLALASRQVGLSPRLRLGVMTHGG